MTQILLAMGVLAVAVAGLVWALAIVARTMRHDDAIDALLADNAAQYRSGMEAPDKALAKIGAANRQQWQAAERRLEATRAE